jgi:hypothetical protein
MSQINKLEIVGFEIVIMMSDDYEERSSSEM